MSKNKISTREIILEKALEMFNEQGVEYVGVRELAKALDMKGGNITYYFPTKNDLVRELSALLSASNDAIFAGYTEPGIYNMLHMYNAICINQYKYRSLFVSLPLWIKQDEEFAKRYRANQLERRKVIYGHLKSLFLGGYFQTAKSGDMDSVLNSIVMTNRFWVSEAIIDGTIDNERTATIGYMQRIAGLLGIIASEKGRQEIAQFMATLV